MVFSRINVFGEYFDVTPAANIKNGDESVFDFRDSRVTPAILLPSLNEDIKIELCSGCKRTDLYAPALAGALFVVLVRGLPLSTVAVEVKNRSIEALISDDNSKCSVFVPKCKVLSSNRRTEVGGVEFFAGEVECEGNKFAIIFCKDERSFSPDIMCLLLQSFDCAAVVCDKGDDRRFKFTKTAEGITSLDAARAAASLISYKAPLRSPLTLRCDGLSFCFTECHFGFLLSCDINRPLTFYY